MKRMKMDDQNDVFKLAYSLVSDTGRNIFLTGKAGTGKTTFLKYLKENCHKNMVVVAPTGVAAINAGGVTIHSFFQLPIGPFVPNARKGFGLNEHVVDKNSLIKNLRLNGEKRKIFQDLELLVIDEVSMLRSDTLDAIHTAMQFIRKKNQAFGGVQVLFIGDLHQLPPVVNDKDKDVLNETYISPFFFNAKVLEENQPLFIELKKIYRQNEEHFIQLLNRLRNNFLNEEDLQILESRYQPNFRDKENKYITLTSHNAKADSINKEALEKLSTPLVQFQGEIRGDFGEKQHPTELNLQLKVGAQVMFIKNDTSPEKKYFNGKIAKICKIEDDEIFVEFPETKEVFQVSQETWENISYSHNDESNEIEENIVGRFIQFPLRLAWAITIHKSQGLTFEHAVIDAGSSFAPGQVYVALSRCTSLEGIILHSRITSRALHTDERIFRFSSNELETNRMLQILNEERIAYQNSRIQQLFDWHKMEDSILNLISTTLSTKNLQNNEIIVKTVRQFYADFKDQAEIAQKFKDELIGLFQEAQRSKNSNRLIERTTKAIAYFTSKLHDQLIVPIREYVKILDNKQATKKYIAIIQQTEKDIWHKVESLQKIRYQDVWLAEKLKPYTLSEPILTPKKKSVGESSKESLAYFIGGKSIPEIAKIRKFTESTIENHLAKFIESGELEVERFLNKEQLTKIHLANQSISADTTNPLTALKAMLHDEFSFGALRIALSYFKKQSMNADSH